MPSLSFELKRDGGGLLSLNANTIENGKLVTGKWKTGGKLVTGDR